MLEPMQASLLWLKSENVWRVKIRFAGSYIEQNFAHDQRGIAWELIQSWMPEEGSTFIGGDDVDTVPL